MERGRPLPFELGRPARAGALGRRRAQIEIGERRAQVEAGAADDDRAPARRQQAIDLGVRQLGVLADAEGRVERQEGHEAVLERGALGGRGHAGERLQARVDLQRVGRHRDGILPARAQQLRERDGDGGLADAGRAEQGEDLRRAGRLRAHRGSIAADRPPTALRNPRRLPFA